MTPSFTKHENISLKKNSNFSEKWLQNIIADDPSILGLGDLQLIERERVQEHAGRLDLLLSDGDSTRYEVELMLGTTDPSHIIRCIEYWDNERRKYPGYEHIAVLVAEDVTSRFLNVMSLMAGNIPMIAIQLSAIQVGEQILLNFIKVLDQTSLRGDDPPEPPGGNADRLFWEKKVSAEILSITDRLLEMANGQESGRFEFTFAKPHIGISQPGSSRHVILVAPKKQYAHIRFLLNQPDGWIEKFEELGLPVTKPKHNRLRVTVTPQQFEQHSELIKEAVEDAIRTIDV